MSDMIVLKVFHVSFPTYLKQTSDSFTEGGCQGWNRNLALPLTVRERDEREMERVIGAVFDF